MRTKETRALAAADELGMQCLSTGKRLADIGRAINGGARLKRRALSRVVLLGLSASTEIGLLTTRVMAAEAGVEWDEDG